MSVSHIGSKFHEGRCFSLFLFISISPAPTRVPGPKEVLSKGLFKNEQVERKKGCHRPVSGLRTRTGVPVEGPHVS